MRNFFYYIVASDSSEGIFQKPDTSGVFDILKHCPHKSIKYIGDSIDDIIAGNGANVDTIGVISPGADKNIVVNNFKHLCAKYILENINDICDFLNINEQN